MIEYFYAFAYDMILNSDFEKWLYGHIHSVECYLERDIFLDLYECDFGCYKDVCHIKQKVCQYFAEQFENVCKSDWRAEIDDALLTMLERCEDSVALKDKLVIKCNDIFTAKQLQKRLQIICRFPEWYGLNWDAFNDLIDLSAVTEIELIDFDSLKLTLPSEADTLLKMFNRHKTADCKIVL